MGSLETEPRKPCRPIASNWRPKGNFISLRDSREGCVEAREEIESGMELKLESGNSEGKEQSNQPLRVWQAGRQAGSAVTSQGGYQNKRFAEGEELGHRLIVISFQAKVQE